MADSESTSGEVSALSYKEQGNTSYQRGDYHHAIYLFSKGLELNPGPDTEHLLYSNRSACYCLLEDFERALADANSVIKLKPTFTKGFTRKGAALQALKRYDDAIAAYNQALKLDPNSEVAMKSLEELKVLRAQQSKRFATELKPTTQNNLDAARRDLEQLKEVRWHVEILKDRIWLADPPLTPFRPRSMFILDVDRRQLLSMTAHPVRDSITLDQLVEFVVSTFLNSGIYPGTMEFSDATLMSVLEPTFAAFNINFICEKMSPEKNKFFEERIEDFEVKEREQWEGNGKFAGVLRQRLQTGLLAIPGVKPEFLKHLLSAAAQFYRSKAYVHFTKSVSIMTADGNSKVAMVTRNTLGQYGVAMSTVEASKSPVDCGTQSYTFADPSSIPFDDADLIERYGWDIVEDRYPLPTIHNTGNEFLRPTLEDLEWYEMVFYVITAFVNQTFAIPTFVTPASLRTKCVVHTSKGRQEVLIAFPPSDALTLADFDTCDSCIEAPIPPAPKERLMHAPILPKAKPAAKPGTPSSNAGAKSAKPKAKAGKPAARGPFKTTATRSPSEGTFALNSPASGASTTSKASATASAPASSPPRARASIGAATATDPRSASPQSSTSASPSCKSAPEGLRHGVVPSYRSDLDAHMGLLVSQDDQFAMRKRMADQERTIAKLTAKNADYEEQIAAYELQGSNQKQLIDQLQERVQELEEINGTLQNKISEASSKDQVAAAELVSTLLDNSQDLMQALAVLDVAPKQASKQLPGQREKKPAPASERKTVPGPPSLAKGSPERTPSNFSDVGASTPTSHANKAAKPSARSPPQPVTPSKIPETLSSKGSMASLVSKPMPAPALQVPKIIPSLTTLKPTEDQEEPKQAPLPAAPETERPGRSLYPEANSQNRKRPASTSRMPADPATLGARRVSTHSAAARFNRDSRYGQREAAPPAPSNPEAVPDGSFISGKWYGRHNPSGACPQDLTEQEYLSEANMVF